MELSELPSKCLVCSSNSNGKRHYGAVVCRACAAFFRRAHSARLVKKCKKTKQCELLKDRFFNCKYCRLQKCKEVGMTKESFQFGRDGYQQFSLMKIPASMDTFCGRSNLIIFQAPSQSSPSPRPFVDINFLMDEVSKVLKLGPESPLFSPIKLGKLAQNLEKVHDNIRTRDVLKLKNFGRNEAFEQVGTSILTVAKWFTHFDEFHRLPPKLQLKILQEVWGIWWKLERLAFTAKQIKLNLKNWKEEKKELLYEYDPKNIDLSWCSTYTVEELKFFIEIPNEVRLNDLTRAMIELDPSDIELSFMLGQLCFHHVGKRFQGEILQVADKFQQILADDLHEYYTNEMKQPHYSKRVASMMKVNNMIQRDVFVRQPRRELAFIFDVFNIDVSHPEMFAGCL